MRNVVMVWPDESDYLINEVALLEGAKWHQKVAKAPIDVLVIGDWSVVSPLKDQLADYNYTLHDGTHILKSLRSRYSNLYEKLPQFHFNGFMRWLCMDEYFKEQSYCSFDSDLVVTSDVLHNPIIADANFTSTSTCFVVMNGDWWLRGYREAISQMNDDNDRFMQRWNYVKDPFILGAADSFEVNEETLVRFLSKTAQIPNKLPENYPYWITPLHLEYYNSQLCLQKIDLPAVYERAPQGELLNGKPLTFLHFQYLFKEYLCTFLMFEKVFGINNLDRIEPEFFRRNGWSRRPDFLNLQQRLRDDVVNGRYGDEYRKLFTRRTAMEEFLFNRDLSGVFNDKNWHTPGFFAGPK